MMVRSRTLKQKMWGYLAFHQRILKSSKVVTLACIKYNTQQTIRLHIINTTLLWCLFVWQNPKSQLKESMLMFFCWNSEVCTNAWNWIRNQMSVEIWSGSNFEKSIKVYLDSYWIVLFHHYWFEVQTGKEAMMRLLNG